jgi:hypothetical protein
MLKNPEAITSTNLRKYMATITQVLDLKEHQLQWVLNHMGHTLDVHKLHYRYLLGGENLILDDRGIPVLIKIDEWTMLPSRSKDLQMIWS